MKRFLTLGVLLFMCVVTNAQNEYPKILTSVNAAVEKNFTVGDTAYADKVVVGASAGTSSSAALEVISTDQGVLISKMTVAQRNAIADPATGLLIYQTNSTPGFYYYDGSAWTEIGRFKQDSISVLDTIYSADLNTIVYADANGLLNTTTDLVWNNGTKYFAAGDVGGTGNNTRYYLQDAANSHTFVGTGVFSIQNPSSNEVFNTDYNAGNPIVKIGDISSVGQSVLLTVNDDNDIISFNAGVISAGGDMGIGTAIPSAALDVNSDFIRVRVAKTPANATDTGNTGDICWDADYIYVCVGSNTWKRVAIATW